MLKLYLENIWALKIIQLKQTDNYKQLSRTINTCKIGIYLLSKLFFLSFDIWNKLKYTISTAD